MHPRSASLLMESKKGHPGNHGSVLSGVACSFVKSKKGCIKRLPSVPVNDLATISVEGEEHQKGWIGLSISSSFHCKPSMPVGPRD